MPAAEPPALEEVQQRNGRDQELFDFLNNVAPVEIQRDGNDGIQGALERAVVAAAEAQAAGVAAEAAAANEGQEVENWGRDVERIVDDLTWQVIIR